MHVAEMSIAVIDALFASANSHYIDGAYAIAIPFYHQILCLAPPHPEAHHALGIMLKELGQLAEAELSHLMHPSGRSDFGRSVCASVGDASTTPTD